MKCPHCSVAFHDHWILWFFKDANDTEADSMPEEENNMLFGIDSTQCPECQKLIFRLTKIRLAPLPERGSFIVYPRVLLLDQFPLKSERSLPETSRKRVESSLTARKPVQHSAGAVCKTFFERRQEPERGI